ncbi:hypothetical protein [Chelatococcus sp.]|uniref:hypothetical protein n=1 Tax=Chelatococcus sp. TaxID=1953771 RepID=UPI001EB64D5B|nr:hypothetical protein [Chelatococcus sp.]MBX3547317.1 hypothetical protein [Chelatococcus sp.]
MTTIAYRDGVLVADTAVHDRGVYCGEVIKIFQAADGTMGGLCGCLGDLAAMRDFIAAGGMNEPPEFKDEESEGILIRPWGKVEWVGANRKRIELTGEFFAIGSGFKLAVGAMHAGADAIKAIEIAAHLDNCTRPPLTVLRAKARS